MKGRIFCTLIQNEYFNIRCRRKEMHIKYMLGNDFTTSLIFLASSDTSMLMSTTISSTSEFITIRDPITYSYDLEYLAQVQEETSTYYEILSRIFSFMYLLTLQNYKSFLAKHF